MSDFKFYCPHCEQSLEASEEKLSQTTEHPIAEASPTEHEELSNNLSQS